MQAPVASVLVRLEQAGADRLLEDGIVEQDRNERPGAFPGMFPARADFRSVLVAEVDAVGGRILRLGVLCWNEGQLRVEREGAEKILVGLPLGFSGETGQTTKAREFATKLDSKVAAAIEVVDERFTSRIAEKNLQAANFDSREQKNLVDSESARIILQEYFDTNF